MSNSYRVSDTSVRPLNLSCGVGMPKQNSEELTAADERLGDIMSRIEDSLATEPVQINFYPGEEEDTKLGGGVKSVRISRNLGGMLQEILKDLDPKVKRDSDVLRTAITYFCLAWLKVKRSGITPDIKAAADAERVRIGVLRREKSRRDVIDHLKMLGSILNGYRIEGELEYAIAVLLEWISTIKMEPDVRFIKLYSTMVCNQPIITDLVRDARLKGIRQAEIAEKFLQEAAIVAAGDFTR